MSSTPDLCPCNSGLSYSECCGVAGRTAANAPVVAHLTDEGLLSDGPAMNPGLNLLPKFDQDPSLFPINLEPEADRIRLVQMSPRWFSESLFLDPKRVKGTCVIESSSDTFLRASNRIQRKPLSFIFHSAFCGSTLMSQALEETHDCLALREPGAISQLYDYLGTAEASTEEKDLWRDAILKVMSRTYGDTQRALVKTSDTANRLMWELQKHRNDVPMLFMYVPLRDFLVSCVRADNRKVWIRDRCHSVLDQLTGLLNLPPDFVLHEDDWGTQAALYWSFNIAVYLKAYLQNPTNVSCLDFNAMLENPLAAVEASGRYLQLVTLTNADLQACLAKLLGRYSKVPELEFSPQLRANLIDLVADDHKDQLATAESQARIFLGNDYPDDLMAGHLNWARC